MCIRASLVSTLLGVIDAVTADGAVHAVDNEKISTQVAIAVAQARNRVAANST